MKKIIKKTKELKEKSKTANKDNNEQLISLSKQASASGGKNLTGQEVHDETLKAQIWARETGAKSFR